MLGIHGRSDAAVQSIILDDDSNRAHPNISIYHTIYCLGPTLLSATPGHGTLEQIPAVKANE